MNNDDLERDLRRVLADPGHRLPDRLVPLEQVHAGAARRRRQHQAVTASLAVLAVVGIGLGVARPWASDNDSDVISGASVTPPVSSVAQSSPAVSSPSPTASDSATTTVPPRHVTLGSIGGATSVTAINDSHWWVSVTLDCVGCSGDLIRTRDDGGTFSFPSAHPGAQQGGRVESIRFVDDSHGTALTQDGAIWSTDDGGLTWYSTPMEAGGFAIEAGGSRTTYALVQSRDDDSIHLWVQVGTTAWKDVATLDETATPGAQNVQVAVQGDRAVVVWRTSKAVVSAAYDTNGKSSGTTTLADCDYTLGLSTLSSGRNAVWLSCPTGTADTVLRSTDDGATWHPVVVPGDSERHVVGAIDANHAVISTANGLGVLRIDETLQDATLPPGVTSSDWTYIGFTNPTHGFAITGDGQLLRSTDGGLHWKTVTYAG